MMKNTSFSSSSSSWDAPSGIFDDIGAKFSDDKTMDSLLGDEFFDELVDI